MGAEGHNSPLHLVRKAIVIQRAFMAHGSRVKPHHKMVLQALRVAKALVQAGFDLEQVIAALQAVGGGDCRLPVPATDQTNDVNHVLHANNIGHGENENLTGGG